MFWHQMFLKRKWKALLQSRVEEIETQVDGLDHTEFERIEFLGDSILNFFITYKLFKTFKDESEGEMSTKKAFLASNAFLKEWLLKSSMASQILGESIWPKIAQFSDRGAGSIFETYLGLMLEGRGSSWVFRFLNKYYWPDAITRLGEGEWQSYRSLVQMLFQKRYQLLPEYEVDELPEGHNEGHRFKARLIFEGEAVAVGFGTSKKKAIESASRAYWQNENEIQE